MHAKLQFMTTDSEQRTVGSDLPLPSFLTSTNRSGTAALDPLLAGVVVEQVFHLAAATRGETGKPEDMDTAEPQLLALEAEDGSTLFIRADALAESVEQLRPEAVVNGVVDFSRFRDPNTASRGLGDILWKSASVLKLPEDGLLEEAKEQALKWAKERFGGQADANVGELTSFLGAKALMWKIESRLAGRPGLYQWSNPTLDSGDRCLAGDPRLQAMAQGKPALIFIHGTASYTLAAYADLRADKTTWDRLTARFPGGIFGYEHRTFSESPAENALALVQDLPRGARISLVSHSRGGLVGDLLCLGQVADTAIDAYRINTEKSADPAGLEREAGEERDRLRRIRDLLASQDIQVQRYVRVASPSRGTRFLSDNLDAALSDFLNVLQWGGGALVGAVSAALGGPVAGEKVAAGASSLLGVVKRLVLEIAGRRIDPSLVPGIAAMRTDSPLAAFLAHPETHRHDAVRMAVIAGDTEFEGFGFSNLGRRVANLFCDWRLFDQVDNDLVVDTDSMYAGLARQAGCKYLYDQDESVTHFRYFRNDSTRSALGGWLLEDDLERLTQFQPLTAAPRLPWKDRAAGQTRGGAPRPVAILIPGIMGSHIEIGRGKPGQPGSGERIWFNPARLLLGQLERIGDPTDAAVLPEDIFEMFYGDLADHLAASHVVMRYPYDWRRPLADAALGLKARIEEAALQYPDQPIRLLAHSMGGLVARTLMAEHPDAWKKVLDSGGRLLMLGTPNNGSHLMVHTLLGKSSSIRQLEMLDGKHGLQEILDIVAGFPGALALLPRPGFVDTGAVQDFDFYRPADWDELQKKNTDRWYPDQTCGVPSQDLLGRVQDAWSALPASLPNPERVAYVFGQAKQTPCGVRRQGNRLELLFTPWGDGSVTWESGKLPGLDVDTRCWYMPVEHADLTGEEEYFPAIVELLEKGSTDKLQRLPKARGEMAANFVLDAPPPVLPEAEEMARAFLGSGPRRRRPAKTRQVLRVAVRAGDVCFIDQPVLCGHYVGDAISGAEATLDTKLRGVLSERERMGVYAGDLGTSAIVLQSPSREEGARGSLPGAVIVGLGQFTGQLTARQVTETVRAAVVRFLLQARDAIGIAPGTPLQLYSLLIGYGSSSSISVDESVAAVTRAVLEANRQFREAVGKDVQTALAVSELCFIELYRDAAISAAQAVLDLPGQMQSDLKRLGMRLEPAASLAADDSALERLQVDGGNGHWSRLIVTDADAPEVYCPPECYEVRCTSAMSKETLERVGRQSRCCEEEEEKVGTRKPAPPHADASSVLDRYYPKRLKYLFLSQRARAEMIQQQQQPGLIEEIIDLQRRNPGYDRQLGHTLFQLMVPLDYKAAARDQARLLLVLDGYTANLPWELLQVDGEALVLRTRMVRQLVTSRFRGAVRTAVSNSACIIANPSTSGFDHRFENAPPRLANLEGAEKEGRAIAQSLHDAGWNDVELTPSKLKAVEVFNTLYQRPWRVLAIAAHGIFEVQGRDGNSYSGVVLSGGLLLTAVELSQMEVVPELVFLSCCHLGSVSTRYSKPNQLAYSVARELIEMGVRCVVAAGWAVDDAAACTFSSTFFDCFCQGETYGDALFAARKAAQQQHPGTNTWGAYQAYGDPTYRLKPDGSAGRNPPQRFVAVEQLLAVLQREVQREKASKQKTAFAQANHWLEQQLALGPAAWAERPDVLQALAAYYGEFGGDGFAAARAAYLRAVQLEDQSGRVAVRAIEQLANLEARRGAKLAEAGKVKEGLILIKAAIQRLESLEKAVQSEGALPNDERAGILGSALKRQAWATMHNKLVTWKTIATSLEKAATAYRSSVGAEASLHPYNTLNALQLAWLSDTLRAMDTGDLARRCGEEARRLFAASKKFWHAVMSADAELTARMLEGTLMKNTQDLAQIYREAVACVPRSAREWDSVVAQWRTLADFLDRRAQTGDDALAQVLRGLAERDWTT